MKRFGIITTFGLAGKRRPSKVKQTDKRGLRGTQFSEEFLLSKRTANLNFCSRTVQNLLLISEKLHGWGMEYGFVTDFKTKTISQEPIS